MNIKSVHAANAVIVEGSATTIAGSVIDSVAPLSEKSVKPTTELAHDQKIYKRSFYKKKKPGAQCSPRPIPTYSPTDTKTFIVIPKGHPFLKGRPQISGDTSNKKLQEEFRSHISEGSPKNTPQKEADDILFEPIAESGSSSLVSRSTVTTMPETTSPKVINVPIAKGSHRANDFFKILMEDALSYLLLKIEQRRLDKVIEFSSTRLENIDATPEELDEVRDRAAKLLVNLHNEMSTRKETDVTENLPTLLNGSKVPIANQSIGTRRRHHRKSHLSRFPLV
jgi:hypothetical protein